MALERWFRRKRPTRADDDPSPAGLWLKCEECSAQIYRKDLEANLYLCTECGHHYRMPADARVAMLADEGSFERWSGSIRAADPLTFEDTETYPERIKRSADKQKRPDAILTGAATLSGQKVALSVMDFFFAGGSMGSVVGEEIARAAERAADEGRAFVSVAASGGARDARGRAVLDADGQDDGRVRDAFKGQTALYQRLDRSDDGRRYGEFCHARRHHRLRTASPHRLCGAARNSADHQARPAAGVSAG